MAEEAGRAWSVGSRLGRFSVALAVASVQFLANLISNWMHQLCQTHPCFSCNSLFPLILLTEVPWNVFTGMVTVLPPVLSNRVGKLEEQGLSVEQIGITSWAQEQPWTPSPRAKGFLQ